MVHVSRSHFSPLEISIGVVLLIYLLIMLLQGQILLGILPVVFMLHLGFAYNFDKSEHIIPIIVSWTFAILGFVFSRGEWLYALPGAAVYPIWYMWSRNTNSKNHR